MTPSTNHAAPQNRLLIITLAAGKMAESHTPPTIVRVFNMGYHSEVKLIFSRLHVYFIKKK
jgi:hypothetical protein